jgi:hypothetical protein
MLPRQEQQTTTLREEEANTCDQLTLMGSCVYWPFDIQICCLFVFFPGSLPLESRLYPLCSGYFEDRVSLFAQASLDQDPPILSFSSLPIVTYNQRQLHTTTPRFFSVEMGSHQLPNGF